MAPTHYGLRPHVDDEMDFLGWAGFSEYGDNAGSSGSQTLDDVLATNSHGISDGTSMEDMFGFGNPPATICPALIFGTTLNEYDVSNTDFGLGLAPAAELSNGPSFPPAAENPWRRNFKYAAATISHPPVAGHQYGTAEPSYGMLSFPDANLHIRCTEFEMGRDPEFYRAFKRQEKRRKREGKNAMRQDSGQDSDLQGRPEAGPMSTFSGHGGLVGWGPDHEHIRSKRRKIKHDWKNNSSSAPSIDPNNLYVPRREGASTDASDDVLVKWCPMFPSRDEDITKISKRHLRFELNANQWTMFVVGNGAYVNNTHYPKDPNKETPIHINHGDEIRVLSVVFRLFPAEIWEPNDNIDAGYGDDESHQVDAASSRASSLTVDDESAVMGAPALDMKADSGPVKLRLSGKAGASSSQSLPGQSKKRKTPHDEDSEVLQEIANADPDEPAIQPRKGPGRPPNNGLMSKRDTSAIDKKVKEYEARGEKAPSRAVLLEVVRREHKEKDARNKANKANSQLEHVVQSIEGPATVEHAGPSDPGARAGPSTATKASAAANTNTHKQDPRMGSPVKPVEECTPDELKKPPETYPVLIDTVLLSLDNRTADLQFLYYLIQKRWPHYKYVAPTTGWQSSIRHNLKDNQRFVEVGKSGKGKYWTIDESVAIDSKKSKKPPSPRQAGPSGSNRPPNHGPPVGMANGNHNAWHGISGVATNAYNPPYPPNGSMPPSYSQQHHMHTGATHGPMQNDPRLNAAGAPNAQMQQVQHAQQMGQTITPMDPRDQTPEPFDRMRDIVNEVVKTREEWLARPEQQGGRKEAETIFDYCLTHFSNYLANLPNYHLPEDMRHTEPATMVKEIFDERAGFQPAYYVRIALGESGPRIAGDSKDRPPQITHDGWIYSRLSPEEIKQYQLQGVGQAAYQHALQLMRQADAKREAKLADFYKQRADRRAARARQNSVVQAQTSMLTTSSAGGEISMSPTAMPAASGPPYAYTTASMSPTIVPAASGPLYPYTTSSMSPASMPAASGPTYTYATASISPETLAATAGPYANPHIPH